MEIKDSGKRESFSTGAVRDIQEGKGRYDLLPAYAIQRLAQHFENGAKKYEDDNWRKGIPLRRFLGSALRHTFKFLEGNRDEDHAAAAAWNLLALIETQEMIRRSILPESLDNLPDFTRPKTFLEVPLSALDQLYGTPAPVVDLDKCGTVDGITPLPSPYDGDWNIPEQTLGFWRINGANVTYVDGVGTEPSAATIGEAQANITGGLWVKNVQDVAMIYHNDSNEYSGGLQWRLHGQTPQVYSDNSWHKSINYITKEAFLTAIAKGVLEPV